MTTFDAAIRALMAADLVVRGSNHQKDYDNLLAAFEGDATSPVKLALGYDSGAGTAYAAETDETDTLKCLAPDGAGSVEWSDRIRVWRGQVVSDNALSAPEGATIPVDLDTNPGSQYRLTISRNNDTGDDWILFGHVVINRYQAASATDTWAIYGEDGDANLVASGSAAANQWHFIIDTGTGNPRIRFETGAASTDTDGAAYDWTLEQLRAG